MSDTETLVEGAYRTLRRNDLLETREKILRRSELVADDCTVGAEHVDAYQAMLTRYWDEVNDELADLDAGAGR